MALIYQCFFFRRFTFTSFPNEVNLKLPNDSVFSLNFRNNITVYRPGSQLNLLNWQKNLTKVSQFYCATGRVVDLLQKIYYHIKRSSTAGQGTSGMRLMSLPRERCSPLPLPESGDTFLLGPSTSDEQWSALPTLRHEYQRARIRATSSWKGHSHGTSCTL